jgi:hypothetical protein
VEEGLASDLFAISRDKLMEGGEEKRQSSSVSKAPVEASEYGQLKA